MYPKGSLATHLSGGSYRNQMVEVPGASRSESKPDLKLALARPAPASSASSRASKAKSQKLKKCKALLSSPTKATSAAKPPVVCVAPKRQSGKRAPGKKGKSGVNGHDYRESIHCHFGDENYDRLKFGNNPQAVKKKAQQTYRAKKKPAGHHWRAFVLALAPERARAAGGKSPTDAFARFARRAPAQTQEKMPTVVF